MMEPVALLRHLVELESPTGDRARMAHIRSFLAAELAGLGGEVAERGEHLVARFGGEGDGDAMVLAAHMDTVWPAGTLVRMPFRVAGDLAHGPGALDMKGGIVVMLEGLRRAMPLTRPVSVLLTADEEIGSPSGRPVVEEAAARARAVLVLEPPVRDGTITTSRSGLASLPAAHPRGGGARRPSGWGSVGCARAGAPDAGALQAESTAKRGVRVNVGQVAGGTGDNVVAAERGHGSTRGHGRRRSRSQLEAHLRPAPVIEGAADQGDRGCHAAADEPQRGSRQRLAERAVQIAATTGAGAHRERVRRWVRRQLRGRDRRARAGRARADRRRRPRRRRAGVDVVDRQAQRPAGRAHRQAVTPAADPCPGAAAFEPGP